MGFNVAEHKAKPYAWLAVHHTRTRFKKILPIENFQSYVSSDCQRATEFEVASVQAQLRNPRSYSGPAFGYYLSVRHKWESNCATWWFFHGCASSDRREVVAVQK